MATAMALSTTMDDLTSDAVARLAARLCDPPSATVDNPLWVAAARGGWQQLPAQVRDVVTRFRRNSGPTGTLVLRNLPIGTPDRTPAEADSVQREVSIPAAVLMMLAHGLGDPVAFMAEKAGALVQDVVPVKGEENVQGNSGSVLLNFHTENAFHDHRPDFVMLFCLRADHEGVAGLRT